MRIYCAATVLLLATGGALGCTLQRVEEKLSEADDYLYWHELWDQSDTPGATFELDNAIGVTRQALDLLAELDCAGDRISQNLTRIVRGRLDSLAKQKQAILAAPQPTSSARAR